MASTADARSSETSSGLLRSMRLGKYRIERQLGAGGMGTVFLAIDTELRRTVALKVLPRERAANSQLVRRFKSEGQAAARLEHENIVKVFESGEIDGHLYLALEYIDGIDVQELVSKRGMLPVRRSIEIVAQVAAALQHAYERGIVHRDIKPSNLLIRKDGRVKLADMGLARAIDETVESNITHAGMTVGTVDYISPEQGSNSKQADIRSDLYSLGCSWYHMLTGEVPFPDGTAIDKLRSHSTAPIPDPRQINERIPAGVVAVLQRLMSKRPENRYQTPEELIADLQQPTLLRHETGAADIAALARAVDDEDSDEAVHASDFSTPAVGRTPRRGKPPRPGAPQGGRQAAPGSLSDSVEIGIDPPPAQPVEPRQAGAKRGAAKPLADRRRQKTEAKAKRSAAPAVAGNRDLPPRAERPGKFAVNHSVVDPQTVKVVGFGLIVLLVVSALGWLAWRAAQDQGGELTPAGANPFARADDDVPPAAAMVAPAEAPETPAGPPPNVITEFRPTVPFPGAADAAGADLPRWVYEARERSWNDAQAVDVGPGGAGHRTAAGALDALPAAGGIIRFHGRGPFSIENLQFAAGQNVRLCAADGSQPVLHLDAQGSRIAVQAAHLELEGLHLIASGRDRVATDPLVDVTASTLLIRNCSITLADPADDKIPAVRLSGAETGTSRCALENVLIRGGNLSAVDLNGGGHELITGNCLIDAGAAPAIDIVEPASHTTLQILKSIVISRDSAVRGTYTGSAKPSVQIRLRQSLVDGIGPNACAIRLTAWPDTPTSEFDLPRATGLSLISEQTVWSGWPVLTLLQPAAAAEPVLVTDEARWLQFWRTPLGAGSRLVPGILPVDAGPQIPDPATTHSRLAQQLGPDAALDEFLDIAALPKVPDSLIARIVADSARPRTPVDLDAPFSSAVVTFDLNKDGLKLNRLLNGPECPDGARVVLTGKKRALMEPVTLRGKTLRLEFDGGGEPLTVEPAPSPREERPPALFQIEHGRLDLVNARVRIPPSERTTYPLRLVQAVDSTVAVRRCILTGQFGPGARETPTIEWNCTGDASPFLLIEDSLVAGQSQAVSGQVAGHLCEFRNSIIVSGGDGLRLTVAAAAQAGTVHITRSLLSAAALFRIGPPADGPAGQLQVFVDQSIYAPSLSDAANPVVLIQPAHGDQTAEVEWWETRTAVSDRIRRFRVADDSRTTAQQFDDAWGQGWGADHVADPVTGSLSVILAARQVEISKSQPSDFRLDAKAGAATAADGGGPLGPDIDRVGPGAGGETSPKTSTTRPPKPAAEPRKGDRLNF